MRFAGGVTGFVLCFACSNDLGEPGATSADNASTYGNTTSTSGDSAAATSGSGAMSKTSGSCNTADVRPIFQANCTQSICHDASQPAGELDLSSADPAGQMLNVGSSLCTDQVRLVAGDPNRSLLWLKLTGQAPDCGDPMPIGGTLSATDLGCIEQWITNLQDGVADCETCGGTGCVDLANDATNCGACGTTCDTGHVCSEGNCLGCDVGETACGANCVDTTIDPEHCGGCGKACGAGETCIGGDCQCTPDEAVTFSGDVAPLLDSTCGGVACHAGRMPKQGLDLSVGAAYASLVGIEADECNDGRLLVEPGAPTNSYLLQKLTGVNLCFGTLMPKADGALPPETLAQLSSWICNGAPND